MTIFERVAEIQIMAKDLLEEIKNLRDETDFETTLLTPEEQMDAEIAFDKKNEGPDYSNASSPDGE